MSDSRLGGGGYIDSPDDRVENSDYEDDHAAEELVSLHCDSICRLNVCVRECGFGCSRDVFWSWSNIVVYCSRSVADSRLGSGSGYIDSPDDRVENGEDEDDHATEELVSLHSDSVCRFDVCVRECRFGRGRDVSWSWSDIVVCCGRYRGRLGLISSSDFVVRHYCRGIFSSTKEKVQRVSCGCFVG